jgi:hypothetical protein
MKRLSGSRGSGSAGRVSFPAIQKSGSSSLRFHDMNTMPVGLDGHLLVFMAPIPA